MKKFLKKLLNLKIWGIKVKFNINNDLEDLHTFQKEQKQKLCQKKKEF